MNCIPFLAYDDARAALDWLTKAYGFEQTAVHEDIRAANSLHEVEAASVVEKTRQIQRQLARSTEDTP